MFKTAQIRKLRIGTPDSFLFQADSLRVPTLLDDLAGKVKCVYIDPPFMTGQKFTQKCPIGEEGWRAGKLFMDYEAYEDQFLNEMEYQNLIYNLCESARNLLTDDGVFYLHLDWRGSGIGRMICDQVFGYERFMNDIVWAYESGGRSTKEFSHKHDTVFMYSKTAKPHFDIKKVAISRTGNRKNHMKRSVDADGRVYRSIVSNGKEYRYYDDSPVYPSDVWTDISHLQQKDPERTGYPTQKPEKLLNRLLAPVCVKGDLVVDLCCGSGTTAAVAASLGCRSVSVDLKPAAIHLAAARTKQNFLMESDVLREAVLEADYNAETGIITLYSFAAPGLNPIENEPLAHIRMYAAGILSGDELTSQQLFSRSKSSPTLPAWCQVAPGTEAPAITVVDTIGRRYVFRYQAD